MECDLACCRSVVLFSPHSFKLLKFRDKMLNFLSSKKSSGASPLQGYKITNVERSKKYGVAADSLRMLKTKASEKFKVNDLDSTDSGLHSTA